MIDYEELYRCSKRALAYYKTKKGKAELERMIHKMKKAQEQLEKDCKVTHEDLRREFTI